MPEVVLALPDLLPREEIYLHSASQSTLREEEEEYKRNLTVLEREYGRPHPEVLEISLKLVLLQSNR